MSSNLELVRSIYADWERGDWSAAQWADPEIDFEMIGGLNSGRWIGTKAMAEVWGTMLNAWENLRAVPEEIRELEDGRILVLLKNEGRGKGSGIEVSGISARSANVFTVRDGKVTRLVLYWDRDRAIADLDLTSG